MRLYIIRHGETEWNVLKRFQGRSDIPLNDEGRRLARITAEALREVPFSRIYTSPLKRAYETAMIIKTDRDIPVIEEPRIIEIGFGEYEGLCCGKEHYNIPDPDFMNFFEKPEAYKPPRGAEGIDELKARTADFLQEIVHNKNIENETILVSTHGAALRGLLSKMIRSWCPRMGRHSEGFYPTSHKLELRTSGEAVCIKIVQLPSWM